MKDKSVLVIDTPSLCRECRLFDRDYVWCVPLNDATVNDDILDNCPLKPLPLKQEETTDGILDYDYETAFGDGWNACLSQITGETE